MQVPSGRRVWPYLACQASLINNHNQEAHAHQEKQSGLPDAGLETGAETIHTCLNRTSHLERSRLLPTVVASPSLGWRPLLLPTTLSTRSAEHHWSRLVVLVDGLVAVLLLASSIPDVDGLDARDYRAPVAPVALTTTAPRSRWLSPRPSPVLESGQSQPFLLIADQARTPTLPVAHPFPRTRARTIRIQCLQVAPLFHLSTLRPQSARSVRVSSRSPLGLPVSSRESHLIRSGWVGC